MAKKGSVLVVDDEEIMRDVLETLLSAEGYRVDLAKTGEEGLEAYGRRTYDVVLLDVSMPGMGGLRALEEILKADEQILSTVAAGIRRRRKDEERQTLRRAMSRSVERGSIIGRSDKMDAIFQLVEQVAPARSTVLITGESGTGKELIARAIHMNSTRAARPFVTVNSSNIPSELLESELFGHTRGAFTGAVAAKKGLFEVADGGSIFLDEIGDIPPETQARLLRVLQEREFIPLGDTTPRKVDVRIVAATNVDLKEAVRQGSFREDLYYRLAVVPIELPPLRERREDILPLAQHFIRKYNDENARAVSEHLAPDVLALLEQYTWPGNVRELENVVERAVVIAPGGEITRQCLPADIADPSRSAGAAPLSDATGALDVSRGVNFYDEVRRFEIDLIRRALDQTGGHQSRAARLLGMNATTLNSKIKTYNIQLRP
jgi:DNA-binding NtrC family response regulator